MVSTCSTLVSAQSQYELILPVHAAETHARKAVPEQLLMPTGTPPSKRLHLALLTDELCVLRLKREGLAEAALPLLEMFFFHDAGADGGGGGGAPSRRFMSWTATEQSASAVLPTRLLASLPRHACDFMADCWQVRDSPVRAISMYGTVADAPCMCKAAESG